MKRERQDPRQFYFTPNRKGDFVIREPKALRQARKEYAAAMQERKEAFEAREREYLRGENCPLENIIHTTRGIEPVIDRPFALMFLEEGENVRGFRYVATIQTGSQGRVSLSDIPQERMWWIENHAKVNFFPEVVLDTEGTFGLHWDVSNAVQDGGVVFKKKGEAAGQVGVWEEIEKDEAGRFRIFHDLNKLAHA